MNHLVEAWKAGKLLQYRSRLFIHDPEWLDWRNHPSCPAFREWQFEFRINPDNDWTPEMDEAFNEVERKSNLGKQILKNIKPKREWQWLTDEEAYEVYDKAQSEVDSHWNAGGTRLKFPPTLYRAIEAKLKEKNNAG